MRTWSVSPDSLVPHGKIQLDSGGGEATLSTPCSITSMAFNFHEDCYKKHSAALPEKCAIPFRLDMRVKLDFPYFLLLVGGGYIAFLTLWQNNKKIDDPIKPSSKPNQDHHQYDNSMPLGEYVNISVTYGLSEMQIVIGDQERFYSTKQAYMKGKESFSEKLPVSFAVAKGATLTIQEVLVTEYSAEEYLPIERSRLPETAATPPKEEKSKPDFAQFLLGLPDKYREEVISTDAFLRALRPLKFKRTLAGDKLTYVAADFGISYAIYASGDASYHHFGWYIVYNGKPETWHRKADYMNEILACIAKEDPDLATRIFRALNDCVNCYGSRCLAKTLYSLNGENRLTCHGRVMLRMCKEDFQDTRAFFTHLNAMLAKKAAGGTLTTEKILLAKPRC